MFPIKEVMTPDVFMLPASCTIEQAAWALMRRGIGGAPVRDRAGNVVGVISKSDLLDVAAGTRAAEAPPATIAEVMTPAVVAASVDGSVTEAIQLMVDHGVHRVFVLDEDGDPVGVVTALDVLRRLAKRADYRRGLDEVDEDDERREERCFGGAPGLP